MKLIISVLLLAVVSAFASAASQITVPTYNRISSVERERILQILAAQGGCSADNVCFALDGSASLTPEESSAQTNFVRDVASIIEFYGASSCIVQYGLSASVICPHTPDINNCLFGFEVQPLQAARTFIRAGLLYCFSKLRKRPGEANKIVLFSDGKANLGGNPVPIANRFRETGGEICAVGVRYQNTQSLLDIVGGDEDKVLTVDSFFELSDILERLIEQVCNVSL